MKATFNKEILMDLKDQGTSVNFNSKKIQTNNKFVL